MSPLAHLLCERVGVLALALSLPVAPVARPRVHPLHTTLTQLTYSPADRTVQVSVRTFADDFRAAVTRYVSAESNADAAASDSAAFAYLAAAITLTDRRGRRLALAWCGISRTGDLLWLCLRAPVPGGLDGLQVHIRLLFELYEDEINIVQASYQGKRESLLFARGDGPKRLP